MLNKVAKKYRDEGFQVLVAPRPEELPAFLRGQDVDLIGRKESQSVAVQVKRRNELRDVPAFAAVVNTEPGWSLDVVIYPSVAEEFPGVRARHDTEYTTRLLVDAQHLIEQGPLSAAVVIACAATEAVLRETAQREQIDLPKPTPRLLLKTAYANGIIGREEWKRASAVFAQRDSIVHGFVPTALTTDAPQFLVELATRLRKGHSIQQSA